MRRRFPRCTPFIASLAIFSAVGERSAAQDVTSNLRGHWKLVETSGAIADDLSTFNHNGTYTGGVALATSTPVLMHGEIAAKFDGIDDYVAVPSESTYDITGVITVAAWIRVDVWDVQWQALVTKGDSAWRLLRDSTNNGVTFACTGLSTLRVASTVAVNDGQWHHIVGVYTGSQLQIYVDGALNNSIGVTGSIATNNHPVQIGRNAESAGREFDGAIYDVRVYNRALSAADVIYLVTQGKPIGHWKLDEVSGTIAADSSGLGQNGAVSGTTAWTTAVRNNGHQFNYTNGDDYITLPSNNYLDNVQESSFTVSAWFKPLSTPPGAGSANDSAYGVLLKSGWHTGLLYTNANRFEFEHFLTGNVSQVATTPSNTYAPGAFHHLVGTVDRTAGATKLYVDGVLTQSTTFTPGTASRDYLSEPWRIGISNPAMGTYRWPAHGVIDDARIYYRAIVPAEVAQLHGLIGHWRFAEGAGTAAADSTLSANNATLSGAAWATDCAGAKALQTNGAGGIAQTAASFTPPSEGTVAFWMQPAAGSTLRRIFGNGGDWEVRQLADGSVVFDLCADGDVTLVSTNVPLDEVGRWYHVAITYDSANDSFAIYIDGELHRTGVNPNNMVQQPAAVLSFGTRTGSVEYWPGALRDFRVYNRRLPAAEISELAGLAAWWKFDEAAGAVAADSSGWGRNGAVTGTPAWTTGKLNNAIQLNGSTYVTAAGLMNSPRNVTIAAWANLTAADTGGAELISLGDCLAIRLNASGQSRAFFYNGSTWTSAAINQTFAGAGWRHFAAVFDDDNNVFRFYVNGAEVASAATTSSISYSGLGANTVIGRHGNGGSTFDFTGSIDDARVYSRALCSSQIMELVNDGGGSFQGVRILQWVEAR